MRYKVRCCYDGSNYVGFQSQKNGPTIQNEIESALSRFFVEEIKIVFASRTDAKVHAYDQVFHFTSKKDLECDKILYHTNKILPKDIKLKSIKEVDFSFHSQHNIHYKHYRYLISLNEFEVFRHNYSYVCFYKLDYELLVEVSKLFIGFHDFSSFNTTPYEIVSDQKKKIFDIKLKLEDNLITIDFYGNSFFRHMVRMMVGAMVDVARGKLSLKEIELMLSKPSKTKYQRHNITGSGLYLMEIKYFDK